MCTPRETSNHLSFHKRNVFNHATCTCSIMTNHFCCCRVNGTSTCELVEAASRLYPVVLGVHVRVVASFSFFFPLSEPPVLPRCCFSRVPSLSYCAFCMILFMLHRLFFRNGHTSASSSGVACIAINDERLHRVLAWLGHSEWHKMGLFI